MTFHVRLNFILLFLLLLAILKFNHKGTFYEISSRPVLYISCYKIWNRLPFPGSGSHCYKKLRGKWDVSGANLSSSREPWFGFGPRTNCRIGACWSYCMKVLNEGNRKCWIFEKKCSRYSNFKFDLDILGLYVHVKILRITGVNGEALDKVTLKASDYTKDTKCHLANG